MSLYSIFFGILLAAGLAVGVYAVGPETFMEEARSLVGMEEETVFVRPPVTAEETPQAAPVNPSSVPAEQPVEEPSDPTGDYLLGETESLARVVIDHKLEDAEYHPDAATEWVRWYYGAPFNEGDVYRTIVPGYTSEFTGAFSAEANLPVGTICYGFNTWGDDVAGTWSTGDGQIRSDPCEQDYITHQTSIEVSRDGAVTGSWGIRDTPYSRCFITVSAFFDVYYEGEYVSTELVELTDETECEYDDPYYNGQEATETFYIPYDGRLRAHQNSTS